MNIIEEKYYWIATILTEKLVWEFQCWESSKKIEIIFVMILMNKLPYRIFTAVDGKATTS